MIQVNATLHTPDGGTVNTGAVIDVTPTFLSHQVDIIDENDVVTGQKMQHDCHFNVKVFRSMALFKSNPNDRVKSVFDEFSVGFIQEDIDIAAEDLLAGLITKTQDWLRTHIEDGGTIGGVTYPGVGTGNTAIVYPTFP